ncbi:MAG: hypothetical protein AAGJ55_07475, partial [Cyanobacteria bacterium J06555_12]
IDDSLSFDWVVLIETASENILHENCWVKQREDIWWRTILCLSAMEYEDVPKAAAKIRNGGYL